jgi:hypothetical protein
MVKAGKLRASVYLNRKDVVAIFRRDSHGTHD